MKSGVRHWLGNTTTPVLRELVLVSRILLARHKTGFLMESRPGDYGSTIPDLHDLRRREDQVFATVDAVASIDLNVDGQLALIEQFSKLYADQPFGKSPGSGLRYYPENPFFGVGAAITLHCFLRAFRPRRVIEVGSGFSSAVILDTNDRFLDGDLACTFIDPYPERLRGLLRGSDAQRCRILAQPIQEVPLETFDELEAGDILFIDSSHVSKVGSDLNRLLFDVLPRVKPGVIIHVHDIYFPFEYPREWLFNGRAWNENYLLRAFLMFNHTFEILLFNSYLDQFHAATIAETMPLWGANIGTSLWLRRVP